MNKLLIIIVLALVCTRPVDAAPAKGESVANFTLTDLNGRPHEFQELKSKVLLLFFTGNGCPVARQSASKLRELRNAFAGKGLEIWVINSYPADSAESIRKEAREFGFQRFPIFRDPDQVVALALGIQRTSEVVAIDTANRTVIYRGSIDDQLSEGAKKPKPDKRFLVAALEEYFAGKEITLPRTTAKGCLINYASTGVKGEEGISYVKDVAPILKEKCANCHSEGNIGPFAFDGYARAKNKARMIEEVLLTKRMPPWHADPHFGKFQNDRSLSPEQAQTLIRWVNEGAPRGEGEDPLAVKVDAPAAWPLGEPDFILKLPQPEKIPATGVMDYRHVQIPNAVTEDRWLRAVAIKPGNRKVVHHVILRAKDSRGGDDGSGRGVMIAGWAPGYFAQYYPENAGRFLPGGALFDLELHYNTIGSEQTDQTEIGLYFLKDKPRLEFRVQAAVNMDFSIPPGEPDSRTFATYGFEKDALLFSMSPHMHLRGSWFKYEALYPDGRKETLLSVPQYDFNWQTEYRLVKPKRMPKGTWILCTGGFDNSERNPANPDPSQRVGWGDQSFEEMFIGFMDVADLPEGTAAD